MACRTIEKAQGQCTVDEIRAVTCTRSDSAAAFTAVRGEYQLTTASQHQAVAAASSVVQAALPHLTSLFAPREEVPASKAKDKSKVAGKDKSKSVEQDVPVLDTLLRSLQSLSNVNVTGSPMEGAATAVRSQCNALAGALSISALKQLILTGNIITPDTRTATMQCAATTLSKEKDPPPSLIDNLAQAIRNALHVTRQLSSADHSQGQNSSAKLAALTQSWTMIALALLSDIAPDHAAALSLSSEELSQVNSWRNSLSATQQVVAAVPAGIPET